jgi:feruloyl esterase
MVNRQILAMALLAIVAAPTAVVAQTPPPSEAAAKCAAFARADLAATPDAIVQITATRLVAAANAMPEHCRVSAYVQPQVGVEMLLPSEWNGKFLQLGCGGFCGSAIAEACNNGLARGYACIVSDMGHSSTALDGKWAYNNWDSRIDFAHRATYVAAVAGKAMVKSFYGEAPQRSYFQGCSTGGRQALQAAQRFPAEFDGIIAGAPVINWTGAGVQLLWSVRATLNDDGSQLLTVADIERVHAAAIAACDEADGVKDNIIVDPRVCPFDPAALQCKSRGGRDCLSPAKVEAVKRIYQGPVNSKGESLYTGGALPGSELNWIGNYISREAGPSTYENFMRDMFGYIAFSDSPGPSWRIQNFDFDRDPQRLGVIEQMMTGSNPDLRAYQKRGGKLIVYQGWADQSVVPLNIIDYVETATRTMGGKAATDAFMRLFMVPGMNHCLGGAGADTIDYLGALERWVEAGQAPDVLVGAKLKQAPPRTAPLAWPLDASNVAFTRPYFPYPETAQFSGSGDVNDAANWRRVSP